MKSFGLLSLLALLAGVASGSPVTVCSGFALTSSCSSGTWTFSNFGVQNFATNNSGIASDNNSMAALLRYDVTFDSNSGQLAIRFSASNVLGQTTGNQPAFNLAYQLFDSASGISSTALSQESSTTGGTASDQVVEL